MDSSILIEKSIEITSTTADLACSFAGGCTYAIESSGLYATLLGSDSSSIKVCGNECALREDLSDGAFAVCELSHLATTFSVDTYSITESAALHGTVFPVDSVLDDSEVTIDHVDNTAGCNFGMTFKADHVAVLDEAKVYINFITSTAPYVDKLHFEGSNDNWATSDRLFTYGQDVHEGWNYINYRESGADKPAYNSFRFVGDEAGSCRVTEFKLLGVEAIADENPTFTCSPSIIINGEALVSAVALSDITYSSANTPLLTSIVPRYGSVLGGE